MTPTPSPTDTSLRVSRLIATSAERAFDAWTDPTTLRQWFGPQGTSIGVAEVDLTVGGEYRVRIDSEDGREHTAQGVYREIDRPHRLVFTWDWLEDDHRMDTETVVTVEFVEHGDQTEVVITHEGFPGSEATGGHNEGWLSSLVCLEEHFA